jgi:hypothetical protein
MHEFNIPDSATLVVWEVRGAMEREKPLCSIKRIANMDGEGAFSQMLIWVMDQGDK